MKMNRVDFSRITIETILPQKSFILPTRYMLSETSTPAYDSTRDPRTTETHCLFHYTLSGSGEFFLNGKLHKVHEGEGFLCIIPHTDMSYRYPQSEKDPWKFICLCFNGGNAQEMTHEVLTHYGPIFSLDANSQIIKRIISLDRNKKTTYLSCLEGYNLISELFSQLLASSELSSDKYHPLITEIKKIVKENLIQNINVSEVSEKLNISREHASRIFHMYTGKTLKAYIKEQRLLYSCHLIAEGKMSIDHISKHLNFSSPSNFSRDFYSVMHITPKQYQKMRGSHFVI